MVNRAIAARNGKVPMWRINPTKSYVYTTSYKASANISGVTSFNRAHVEQFVFKAVGHAFSPTELNKWIEVEAITVSTFLEKYGIASVDVLQIDTEGFDWEIIKMFFAAGVVPRVINFEVKNLSPHDQEEAIAALEAQHFSTRRHGGDMLAFRSISFG